MTVYVDDMKARFGRLIMCHMIADTDDELHAMADRIGVARRWHQSPPRHHSHYDIAQSKKSLAISCGAVAITAQEAAMMCRMKKDTGAMGTPDEAARWYDIQFRKNHGIEPSTPAAPEPGVTLDMFG